MSEAEIRIGILGGGRWTREVHLPNLRQIPGARVTAISTTNLENRRACREAWGGPVCFYEEPEDLLEEELDAVIVCTPNHTHEALALRALERGKHVLCEKPVALTPEGVDRIAAAREQAGAVFQADLELRYCDVVRRMEELIQAGELGAVKLAHCLLMRNWPGHRGWRSEPDRSGGMFLELGIHYLDLFNALAATSPTRVFATGGHGCGGAMPDYMWCTVDYADGMVGSFGLTVLAEARKEITVEVVGTEARLQAQILAGRVSLWRRGAPEPEDRSPDRPPDYAYHGFPGALEATQDWIRCIRTGDEPEAGLAAARRATAVSAAAENALRTGLPVSL